MDVKSIETKLEEKSDVPTGIKEIQNIENAMDFIEESVRSERCFGMV